METNLKLTDSETSGTSKERISYFDFRTDTEILTNDLISLSEIIFSISVDECQTSCNRSSIRQLSEIIKEKIIKFQNDVLGYKEPENITVNS